MPYSRITELPQPVKGVLPKHGQQIYKEAFNSAWEEYKKPSERMGDSSREEVAHKVAWSAVKNVYKKDGNGKWVKS